MKKSVLFTAILLMALIACVLVGCMPLGGKVVENPDTIFSGVKQISLSEYKREYWLGENLDLTNAELKILLDTGEIKKIDPTNTKTVSVSGYDRFQEGTQTVTVQYGGKYTSTFEVVVTMPKIKSIALKSYPAKLDYIIGDRLDMTGAVITVFMENGADVDFTVDNSIVTGTTAKLDVNKEFINTGERLELNIRYGSKSIPFYVNVAPTAITGISVAEWPAKKSYYLGETAFDPSGLKLNYTYDNGKTEIVNAESQSNLRYVYDFSAENNQSPVKVQYLGEDGEALFEAGFTVIVNDKRYVSLTVTKRPDGADSLIEGFSEIDLPTGLVLVAFDDGSTVQLAMDDPSISISRYDNRIVGSQTVNVYYMNNENNYGSFSVITHRKSAESVTLEGVDEIQTVAYYEGQEAKISIAKLYYTVRYNNGTVGESTPVSESMLAEGIDLFCYGDGGAAGEKTLRFVIDGISVEFKIDIIAKAVQKVEIDALPTNRYMVAGGAPNLAGGVVRATYNNGTNEKIDMTDSRITVSYDTAAVAGSVISVKVYVGENAVSAPFGEYAVSVVEKSAESVSLQGEPAKLSGYKYGDAIDFTGLKLEIRFAGNVATVLTAEGSAVTDGVLNVIFRNGENGEERIPVSVLLNNNSNVLSVSDDIYVYYYGVRADKAFRVTVEERTLNGISVVDTDTVPLEMFVGTDYGSVEGLVVKVTYTDRSSDTVTFGKDTAMRVTKDTEITENGFYWYLDGDISIEGAVTVTVVYAYRNQAGVVSTYPSSYTVYYRNAAFLYIAGIYTMENGLPVAVDTLGTQPKGLTPYLMNYYVGCYYEDDTRKYVPLTVSMTDYNVKNLTIGSRPVIVSYGGDTFLTSITVTDESVRSVSIGKEPRKNYVYTESLSLVGGTLIRTFYTDGAEKKDTVDMGEANVSLLTKWPKSVEDFNGARKITVTVELRYENVAPVTFAVDVYQPIDLVPTIVNTQNYYGNVSNPSVSLGEPLDGFTLPNYTVRYATDAEGLIYLDGIPTIENGNTIYPTPKTVGTYYVVVTSEGNRYYHLQKKVVEFSVSPLAITLKPNYVTKTYGTDDPTFSYTASNEALWQEAMYDENGNPLFSGGFIREAGEDAGEYKIVEDAGNRFRHPYFVISVEEAGTLTIRPAIIRLELNPSKLFYAKDENGSALNQKNNIDFRFAFVTVALDGTETSVTEDEIEKNLGNPAYKVYEQYLKELRTDGRRYTWDVAVKGADGTYDNTLPVDALGEYSLKITLNPSPTQAANFLLYDPDNPSVGTNSAYHKISVVAEPYASPIVGNTTLRLSTSETDLAMLETLVQAKEEENGTSYDLVATDNFVYIWKYRNTAAQRERYPEGKYLAYNTAYLGNQWITEDNANGGGFKISRNHLSFDANGAFLRLKFFGNGDDRAESFEVSMIIPNVY